MKTIIISIIVFLVGGALIFSASKNGKLFQGSFQGGRGTVRQEYIPPRLVGGGGISRDMSGKWNAQGDECQIYDVEITDQRTGEKRVVTMSTCPMKCCYTGKEMTKADDWAAKAGVNKEQKKGFGAQLRQGGVKADQLPAGFGGGQGKEGSLFVCDPNQEPGAMERLLGRAGFGTGAGGGGGAGTAAQGGRSRSWYAQGGDSKTDQADAIARYTIARIKEREAQERMDRIKNDPEARERQREAKTASGNQRTFEQQMERKYGKDYEQKMSDREKQDHDQYKKISEDAQKKREADQKEFDKAKEDRDKARTDADTARQDHKDSGGDDDDLKDVDDPPKDDDTQCAPEDDKCLDENARKRLEAGLAALNEILARNGIAPITINQLDALHKNGVPIDWKINPAPEDADGILGKRPPEQEVCTLPDPTKSMPNPEGGEPPQCNFDCTVDQMEVGHCEDGQQQGQGAPSRGPEARCGDQRGVIQQGAIDCPQDNPNCGLRPPQGGGGGGGIPDTPGRPGGRQ